MPAQPEWKALEPEIMQQFQAVLRFDTRNPPGNEHLVAEYLKGVFDKAGIPAQIFALDPNRSNVVARLKGNGRKKPLLDHGSQRRRHRGRIEVEVSAVQRDARRRLGVRAGHGRRQRQPHRPG